ncbi:MAG TPA: tRNA pseudouridine(55) synthase TruB [Candidatus Limnocylindria bacterium]|nr:tRNA pseudouridine(55) synthase TruB [Candidatus Limnocylindria bacterium]
MDAAVNFYKPPGMSSAQAVAFLKARTGMKAGHAGTLDPEAAGVLPILLGKATRLNDYLPGDKAYLAEIAFTGATDTQDAQGRVVQRGVRVPGVQELQDVLPRFIGDITQVPPQYSALKVGGEAAYTLARAGKTVALAERPVRIDSILLLRAMPNGGFLLRVRCGKGTYIRTLCHDIGQALACPAHMRFLLREESAGLKLDSSATPDDVARWAEGGCAPGATFMSTMGVALAHLPSLQVPLAMRKPAVNGVKLLAQDVPGGASLPEGEPACLYLEDGLLGVYRREGPLLACAAMLREAAP